MSQLQRSVVKARVSGASPNLDPTLLHRNDLRESTSDEESDMLEELPIQGSADEDSSSASSASSASSTGTIRPSPSKHLFARPRGLPARGKIPDPLPWYNYFDQELYLDTSSTSVTKYHVYLTCPADKAPLFVTHHGAGSSGLSFALFAAEIRKILPRCGILSLDARGHGETVSCDSSAGDDDRPPLDMGLSSLSQDVINIITLTRAKMKWAELPDMVLLGHSLGGAVMTDVVNSGALGSSVLGYGVFDVVEGSAMDALQSMHSYLSSRPQSFPSIGAAIEWHTRSRTIRDSTSARISVPSLLRSHKSSDDNFGTTEPPWTWRTDLAATKPFWEGWFVGLSRKFLEGKGGKLLLLAGTDRLDKELMIGQMQGKYQLQVFPDAGHFIHEDQAQKTAVVVADFYKRNDRSALILPPKIKNSVAKKT